jgi:hypothetical protein
MVAEAGRALADLDAEAVAALARDGLVQVHAGQVSLPG